MADLAGSNWAAGVLYGFTGRRIIKKDELNACMKVSRDVKFYLYSGYDLLEKDDKELGADTLFASIDPFYMDAMADCDPSITEMFARWNEDNDEFFALDNW